MPCTPCRKNYCLTALDWVMNAVSKTTKRITWNLFDTLEDISLLSSTFIDMQEKINLLTQTSERIGLEVNVSKTKAMRVIANNNDQFQIDNHNIEDVNKTNYLWSII